MRKLTKKYCTLRHTHTHTKFIQISLADLNLVLFVYVFFVHLFCILICIMKLKLGSQFIVKFMTSLCSSSYFYSFASDDHTFINESLIYYYSNRHSDDITKSYEILSMNIREKKELRRAKRNETKRKLSPLVQCDSIVLNSVRKFSILMTAMTMVKNKRQNTLKTNSNEPISFRTS